MEYIAGVVGLLWCDETGGEEDDELDDVGDGGETVVDLGRGIGEVGVGGRGALAVNLLVLKFWDLLVIPFSDPPSSTRIIVFLKSATVLSNWEANTTSSYVGGSSLELFSS